MGDKTEQRSKKPEIRILLWLIIALYTYFLPDARLVYNAIVETFGQQTAYRVPQMVVLAVGIGYVLAILIRRRSLANLLYLVPAGLIALAIMQWVENPNKHIHIPEYVLMAWLLYAVLSRDHYGRGLFVLIFLLASLLGVVDELEQGIHPARFYGWSDMLVNSASALIGVFTILGLSGKRPAGLAWVKELKNSRGLIWLALLGILGAALMCVVLFRVQAAGQFQGIYPDWLLAWNGLFLLLSPIAIAIYFRRWKKSFHRNTAGINRPDISPATKTARLWIMPLLVILWYMHALIVWVAITGAEFI